MTTVDPTAPGGMSMAALRLELAEEHGTPMADTKGWKFPALIDAVVTGRQARELIAEVREHGVGVLEPDEEPGNDYLASGGEEADDFDDLLADLEELTGPADDPLCGCGSPESDPIHTIGDPGNMAGHVFVTADLYPDDIQIKLTPEEQVEDAMQGAVFITKPLFIGMPGTRDYIFDGHSGTGPSAAERWMDCTASLGAARAFLETLTPNQRVEYAKGSAAARQGTTAHSVAETQARVILGDLTPEEAELSLLELTIHPEEGEDYDEEMEGYVAEYVDLVQSYVEERGAENVLIEQRVTACIPLLSVDADGEAATYDLTGSLDLGVMPTRMKKDQKKSGPFQRLVVGDLKYGEGIDVDVDRNPQLRIYALGVLALIVEKYDGLPDWLVHVDYIIAQPRLGGIKTYTETVDDLLDWQENVLSVALTEALGGPKAGAKFSPSGSTCQWCPARGGCPALLALRQDEASELFDVMIEHGGTEFPETSTLDDAELAKFYTQVRGLVSLHDELKAELQRRAYRGNHIPGYGLVNYSPPRSWKPEAAEELDPDNRDEGILTEEQAALLWQHKLVTPTAAEKALGEAYEQIKALVVKPDKRPVIAPEGDRRSKWEGKAPEDMFDIEEG